MNATAARLTALALGLAAGGTTAAAAAVLLPPNPVGARLFSWKELVFPGTQTRLREEGPRRNSQVLAEIRRLSEHPWAGVYRTKGDYPDELAIAPEAGFTLHEGSWCEMCDGYSAVGRIVSVDGATLKLGMDLAESIDPPREDHGLDDTLHLVRWGALVFAVPGKRMESFCAEVSDGTTFPAVPFRTLGSIAGFDFVHPPRPAGRPLVPKEFERLILERPISCEIVALVEWQRRPELDGKEQRAWDAVYSIAAGADDGLAPGMRLFVEGGTRWLVGRARVERVDRRAGRIRLFVVDERRAWAEGLAGTRATTLDPGPAAR